MDETGTLIQLKSNSVLQNFKSFNVLLFYSTGSKILYDWIGKKAPPEVIAQIVNAEQLILGMHPDLTVLQHIMVKEQDKNNVIEFFSDIGISLEDYKERMKLWYEWKKKLVVRKRVDFLWA